MIVPGSMADRPVEPLRLAGSAMVAAVIGRSEPPKALERRSRIVPAPRATLTVWRIVAFWKTTPLAFWEGWCQLLMLGIGEKSPCFFIVSPSDYVVVSFSSSLTYGAGGKLAGSVSCGIVAHIPVQCFLS